MLLILSCCTQKEHASPGDLLFDLLYLPGRKISTITLESFENKANLVCFLRRRSNLTEYTHVHIIGRGDISCGGDGTLRLPRGTMRAGDFPDQCFDSTTVSLSSCSLGQNCYSEAFIHRTSPETIISPQRSIALREETMFYSMYYYEVLCQGLQPKAAFERSRDFFNYTFSGEFEFTETEEIPCR